MLSWLFPFSVPSQELQLRPGVWHISGRNAWPLGWPLRRGAGRPAQSLGEPTPGACSSLRRHSGTRLPGSEGPQARGRGFWQPKQLPALTAVSWHGPVTQEMVGVNEKDPCACVVKTEVAVETREMRCPGRACLDVIRWGGPTGCHGMSCSLTLAEQPVFLAPGPRAAGVHPVSYGGSAGEVLRRSRTCAG
uniref:Uncharacterized protein n=1 Tax=Rousettus aegyptiacus TaxID=9407 RepID=A0A7J8H124_ROUAE|nr:hypothetical protein HJG63_011356 [Rousettus aegyptiacus]